MKPKRGDIWLVEFEPQRGAEIQKTRPAVVLSIAELDLLPLRIVAPVREYKMHHEGIFFYFPLTPNSKNGLSKKSTVDCAQMKSFAIERFIKKIGVVGGIQLEQICQAVGFCVGM